MSGVALWITFFYSLVICSQSLSTSGRWIVDSDGQKVRLGCVNWYGGESPDFVVGGLEVQSIDFISGMIKSLGFNCVRLPWSVELVLSNPLVTNTTILASEKDMVGLPALEILDRVVNSLTNQGLMVILDNHVSTAGWCCNDNDGNGLWWSEAYPESDWIEAWTIMATRHANNSLVVGADLRNELRLYCASNGTCYSPSWGSGDQFTDWHRAAETMGNILLHINPNLLIIVEGINFALDLTGVRSAPIQLQKQNQLVYEAHNYQWDYSVNSYDQYAQILNHTWGYILEEGQAYTAPIWLGEFGTCHDDSSCVNSTSGYGLWFSILTQYIAKYEVNWGYWAIDGTESSGAGRKYGAPEDYGILNVHWDGVALQEMMTMLASIQS